MTAFFDTMYAVLGYPFGYVLRFIYDYIAHHNYGLSLILFTLFARLLMIPTTISQQKSTVKTQRIQPKIRRISEKYKGDQQKIQEETQALYRREGVNPMNMGCLPLVIQLPIIYGLIGVIYHPLKYALLINSDAIAALTEQAKVLMGDAGSKVRFVEIYIIEHINELKGVAGVSDAVYQKIENFNFNFCGISLGSTPQHARVQHSLDNSRTCIYKRYGFEHLLDDSFQKTEPLIQLRVDGLYDAVYAFILPLPYLPVPRRYRSLLDCFKRLLIYYDGNHRHSLQSLKTYSKRHG